ncbi:lens fiber membrane intrinsic -like [Pelobates cultripes]|uniref:Lens fiber membrane intrinsic -like n=1 Tax=Pelobates cultripes TaxID=61616 RepID=A0AAD1WR19_PELCU|nr:lens fiber membrane intrinsic -like [Pelobates cultripes]
MFCANVIGIAGSSLSFVLLFTGILTDFWLVNFGVGLTHEGLWQICSKDICSKIAGLRFIEATRALLIISMSFLTFAMLSSCLSFKNFSIGKITCALIAALMEFLAVLFLITGMSVYTGETAYQVNNNSYNYQWSFYLCWTATLTTLTAGISHVLAHKVSPQPGYESV